MAEYDELGQQLDALLQESSLLKAPGLFQEKQNPGSRAAYQVQRESLSQRIADLKRRYEASLGNVGAVTGRTLTGMNAKPIPALRFDAPQLQRVSSGAAGVQNSDLAMQAGQAGALADVGKPRVRTPQKGVFDGIQPSFNQTAVTDQTGAQESGVAVDAPAETPATPAAAVPAAPAATTTAPSHRDEFLKRISGTDKTQKTGMTDEQKGQALMEAGLAIMAAASKPGSSAMGAIGQGGMQGTAVAREMERINRERADKLRAEDRANVRTEFTLAGRDEDRADRKADKAEGRVVERERIARETARDTQTANYQNRHLDMLRDQFKAGSKVVKEAADGTYTIISLDGSPAVNTGVKYNRKDDRPAEVQLLDALANNPKRMETYKEIKGEKGGISNKDIFNKAFETTVAQVKEGNQTPVEQLLQQNTDLAKRAAWATTGTGTVSKGAISRKSKAYQDRLKTRAGGDSKRFDAELQAAGYTVTD